MSSVVVNVISIPYKVLSHVRVESCIILVADDHKEVSSVLLELERGLILDGYKVSSNNTLVVGKLEDVNEWKKHGKMISLLPLTADDVAYAVSKNLKIAPECMPVSEASASADREVSLKDFTLEPSSNDESKEIVTEGDAKEVKKEESINDQNAVNIVKHLAYTALDYYALLMKGCTPCTYLEHIANDLERSAEHYTISEVKVPVAPTTSWTTTSQDESYLEAHKVLTSILEHYDALYHPNTVDYMNMVSRALLYYVEYHDELTM